MVRLQSYNNFLILTRESWKICAKTAWESWGRFYWSFSDPLHGKTGRLYGKKSQISNLSYLLWIADVWL